MATTRILHVSDLHFGRPAVLEQIDAIEAMIQRERFDVVAISGDVSQRARIGEFQRAAAFIRDTRRVSRVICVPGNHDVKWWESPLHLLGADRMYETYRTYIDRDLEPVLRVEGCTLVGLNTAQGVHLRTLTKRPRDLSIIGALRPEQLQTARREFEAAPATDARVVVMHHNPLRGELSQRLGLTRASEIMDTFAGMGVDLILCGHDHQEAVHRVEQFGRGTVVAIAGTLSDRSRGKRPSSVHAISLGDEIRIVTHLWASAEQTFVSGPTSCFARSSPDSV
ncbi:MAG: metallophosphoesterase [Gemmatimonadota bacterium]